MFQKLKQDYEELLAKFGIISNRLKTYINIILFLATKLLGIINTPGGKLVLTDILPNGLEENLVADIITGIQKAIAYLTQSQAVLSAATPELQLQAFLAEVGNDAPGLQKTKIWALVVQVMKHLDGGKNPTTFYSMIVSKYKLIGDTATTA